MCMDRYSRRSKCRGRNRHGTWSRQIPWWPGRICLQSEPVRGRSPVRGLCCATHKLNTKCPSMSKCTCPGIEEWEKKFNTNEVSRKCILFRIYTNEEHETLHFQLCVICLKKKPHPLLEILFSLILDNLAAQPFHKAILEDKSLGLEFGQNVVCRLQDDDAVEGAEGRPPLLSWMCSNSNICFRQKWSQWRVRIGIRHPNRLHGTAPAEAV